MITEQETVNSVKPFTISIPQADIDDLKSRLKNTRWPDELEGAGWDYGTNTSYLKELASYWQNEFDWRAQEKKLNQFKHFKSTIDGMGIHFIHEKHKNPDAMPLLLMHGWPSTFLQLLPVVPLLSKNPKQDFHLIIPSLPGYGFSDRPTEKGMDIQQMAKLFHKLMTEELGYKKYAIRATDLGAGVGREMAILYPKSLYGIHFSGSNPNVAQIPENLSAAEKEFVKKVQGLLYTEAGYAIQQSSKPQTLTFGLNDSPVGLAAWIIEKFRSWSDNDGNVESAFSKDDLLTNISIYWFTQTIGSSVRLYYESSHSKALNHAKKVEVPTAMAMLPKDIAIAPREWEERSYNVQSYNVYEKGGHFAEWEEPEVIAEDVAAFFAKIKQES